MQKNKKAALWQLTYPLLAFSLVATAFLIIRIVVSESYRYWFLPWNLLLAWVPVIAGIVLVDMLKHVAWSSWKAVVVSLIWLLFLPNSFYLITDFIHLQETNDVSLLYDVVVLAMFAFVGFFLGFISLLLIHIELIKRFKNSLANKIILVVILASSFAIYLGRYLRWNSWDVVANPFGIIYDLSDRLGSPSDYPLTFVTTSMFFVVISTFYFCALWLVRLTSKLIK